MCLTCYEEIGSPAIVTTATLRAADLIRAADRFGPLHLVIDDWNLTDGILLPSEPAHSHPDRDCYEALVALTWEERASALAIADGFLARWGGDAA